LSDYFGKGIPAQNGYKRKGKKEGSLNFPLAGIRGKFDKSVGKDSTKGD